MKGSFAEELYSESLQHQIETDVMPSPRRDQSDSHDEEPWCGSDEELDRPDLDREWQRRHDQFHTSGYRDGIIAGKEAAAQEGFNIGFKESVLVGYNWGLVRGVTSAFTLLPDDLKERLIETREKRTEFQKLYESAYSISTTDALKLFNESLTAKIAAEQSENAEIETSRAGLQEQRSEQNQLLNYAAELQSLVLKSPAVTLKSL
nr:putative tRNA 2'-phosphotransferase isoform X1 [Ziziphus jujuba var. spinosa]XP_048329139.1 putative tRNA 2'-phosphotransferase isoform X1 [Ziziphus jujuba var. spinosa]